MKKMLTFICLALMLLGCGTIGILSYAAETLKVTEAESTFDVVLDNKLAFEASWPTSTHISINVGEGVGNVWNIDKPQDRYNQDYIFVNGKSLKEWNTSHPGAFARVSTANFSGDGKRGRVLDIAVDGDSSPIAASKVKTVELRKGMRMYRPSSGRDLQSNDGKTQAEYNAAYTVDAELQTTYILTRKGDAFTRLLKQEGELNEGLGKVAADAVTITAMPAKAHYKQYFDNQIDLSGMEITVKYQDESTAKVTDTSGIEVIGFDNTTEGQQDVQINYNGALLTFSVTINKYIGDLEIAALNGYNFKAHLATPVNVIERGCLIVPLENRFGQRLPKNLDGVELFGKNGTSLKINGKSVNEWKNTDHFTGKPLTSGGVPAIKNVRVSGNQLKFYMDENKEVRSVLTPLSVKTVEIDSNFQLPDFTSNNLIGSADYAANVANYVALTGGRLPFRIILQSNYVGANPSGSSFTRLLKQEGNLTDGMGALSALAITVKTAPAKTEYSVGEAIDVSGLVLNIKYQDGGLDTVAVTADMVAATSTDIPGKIYPVINVGAYKVEYQAFSPTYPAGSVSYDGNQSTVELLVKLDGITDVTLKSGSDIIKKEYNMGEDIDLAGLELRITYGAENTVLDIPIIGSMVVSYNKYAVGAQTVKIEYSYSVGGQYQTFKHSFSVTVIDSDPDRNMTIDTKSLYPSEDSTREGYAIKATVKGNVEYLYAIWNVQDEENVGQYLILDGKSVKQRIAEGEKINVKFYGYTMWIYFNESGYPDGLGSTRINRIEILPGFQWYTYTANNWNDCAPNFGSRPKEGYIPVEGCIVKEKVILDNNEGANWIRPLSVDEDGYLAEDAFVIATPANKLEFAYGEEFSAEGMTLSLKYLDGGAELITVTDSMVAGFDAETSGEQELRVRFNGKIIKYTVTVAERTGAVGDDEGDWKESDYDKYIDDYYWTKKTVSVGGCEASAAGGTTSGVAFLLILGLSITLIVKRRA